MGERKVSWRIQAWGRKTDGVTDSNNGFWSYDCRKKENLVLDTLNFGTSSHQKWK